MRLPPLLSLLMVLSLLPTLGASTVVTCMEDCAAENRNVTRPWHAVDALGRAGDARALVGLPLQVAATAREAGEQAVRALALGRGVLTRAACCSSGGTSVRR